MGGHTGGRLILFILAAEADAGSGFFRWVEQLFETLKNDLDVLIVGIYFSFQLFEFEQYLLVGHQ